jgi:hypothetical protein
MITGTTFINHAIRANFGLSLQEYTVMQFLQDCAENKLNPLENCEVMIAAIWDQICPAIVDLEQSGFVKDLIPTEKWTSAFNSDIDKLWSIHKKGNKKTAAERLKKVLKKVPIDELEEKLKIYVKSKPPEDFKYLKGLDVWLNPAKEHWNDPIVQEKKEQQPEVSFEFRTHNR